MHRTSRPENSRKIFGKTTSGMSRKLAAKVSALSASRVRSSSRRVYSENSLKTLRGCSALEEGLQEAAEQVEQDRVALQQLAVSGLHDLDDDHAAVEELRLVDLADRGRTERIGIDPGEHRDHRTLQVLLDDLFQAVERHRGQAVEEVLELVGDLGGQDVLAQREHLPELDVGGPEDLEPLAQLHRERQRAGAPCRGTAGCRTRRNAPAHSRAGRAAGGCAPRR